MCNMVSYCLLLDPYVVQSRFLRGTKCGKGGLTVAATNGPGGPTFLLQGTIHSAVDGGGDHFKV